MLRQTRLAFEVVVDGKLGLKWEAVRWLKPVAEIRIWSMLSCHLSLPVVLEYLYGIVWQIEFGVQVVVAVCVNIYPAFDLTSEMFDLSVNSGLGFDMLTWKFGNCRFVTIVKLLGEMRIQKTYSFNSSFLQSIASLSGRVSASFLTTTFFDFDPFARFSFKWFPSGLTRNQNTIE